MSIKQHATEAKGSRWFTPALSTAAVVLLAVPGIAAAGGRDMGSEDKSQMVAEAKAVENNVVQHYNERKWDEVQAFYAEDAILVSPNHEPVQGPAAIAEYLRSVRDSVGPVDCGGKPLRSSARGGLVSLVTQCSAYSGQLRFAVHGGYERQPDGSMRFIVDMFGVRDPLK